FCHEVSFAIARQFLRCIFKGRFDGVGQHEKRHSHSRYLVQALVDPRFLSSRMAGTLFFRKSLTSRYVLSNGEELSEAQQEELLQNLNAALAEDTFFISRNAKAKQEMYETLIISASLPLVLYTQGQETGDSSLIKQAKEMA
ncbi:MAG: hypothetical protein MET45_13180, partial [Nostoc sp. LLA-1]|nr:hypothetical protein [Cyanocohniella sp. LLY]